MLEWLCLATVSHNFQLKLFLNKTVGFGSWWHKLLWLGEEVLKQTFRPRV